VIIPPIPCCANCKRGHEVSGKVKCRAEALRETEFNDKRGQWRDAPGWCPLHKFRSEE
jgi:hypothetical protein